MRVGEEGREGKKGEEDGNWRCRALYHVERGNEPSRGDRGDPSGARERREMRTTMGTGDDRGVEARARAGEDRRWVDGWTGWDGTGVCWETIESWEAPLQAPGTKGLSLVDLQKKEPKRKRGQRLWCGSRWAQRCSSVTVQASQSRGAVPVVALAWCGVVWQR
ncbi:hypothetical protein LIA77_11325 [Sarocladium implicatum]|nr:hypothetical protein LIA77_11325 [Sarocladium implicatum]